MDLSEGILAHVIIPNKMEDSFGEDEDGKSCVLPKMSGDLQGNEPCPVHEVKGKAPVMDSDQDEKDTTGNDGNTIETETRDEEEKKPHICHHCYVAFSDLEEFMDHMEIHDNRTADNPSCDVKCEQNEPDQHLETHDSFSVPNKEEQNPFPDIKVENSEYDKVTHTVILNLPSQKFVSDLTGPVMCSCVCGKTFNSIEKFQKHSIVHGPHNCKLCGKTFKRRNLLNKHLLVHADAKPLKCDLCGEGFRKHDYLKKAQTAARWRETSSV